MKIRAVLMLTLLAAGAIAAWAQDQGAGAVYTMSNSPAGNSVLFFERAANGALSAAGAYPTGGTGTGGGLGNQAGVILSDNGKFLFAVNAGSNTISALAVRRNGLEFLQTINSGGRRPVSLALSGRLLFVLNAGGSAGAVDNIVGFRVTGTGKLEVIPGSTRPLSSVSTGPAQIGFSNDGGLLVVTERTTNNISVFLINQDDDDQWLQGPFVQASPGQTPFGFAFGRRDQLIVSEAFGGAANASAVSSYNAGDGAPLKVISASVPTTESAACWIALSKDRRFAYASNTGSASISGYRIGFDGELELLHSDGVTASTGTGSRPVDLAFADDGRFLYVLSGGTDEVRGFRFNVNGSLTPLAGAVNVPAGANGLAAR